MKKSKREGSFVQKSESFLLGGVLAFSGGFQDAYTYNVRDGVFSNAQTGNVVLMSQHMMSGNWMRAFHYLVPVIAFIFGVMVAEKVQWKYKYSERVHWRQIMVLVEMFILLAVGFIPLQYNMIATMLVSFSCSIQVQTFRKVNGYGYASTMCIGNLRSGTEALSMYLREHKKEQLRKMLHYYGIIFIFAVGAGMGGILSVQWGVPAIWVSSALLAVGFVMMYQ